MAGSLLLPSLWSCSTEQKKRAFGLQLYTLRNIISSDVQGTLKQVSEIGYSKLETYSYGDEKIFNIPFDDFVKMAKDLGMEITSGHYSSGFNSEKKGTLRNDWERAVSDAKKAGQDYMVVPYLEKDERATIDDYKKICELLNKGAEVCKQYGMKMGYHNHEFEFVKIDDQVPYDVMLAELDPSLVTMELDLYWVVRGGYTPQEYFSKYPGRFELWHAKDMNKEDRTKTTSPGLGSIDFKEIFKHAEHAGMKHYFVEIENYEVSEYESIKNAVDYLKKL